MRYAIWAAVSSEAQATDEKVSLSEQRARCKAAATQKGWEETAGPFIVPGESRTRWVNLRDAEAEMPELHAMLESAHRGEFDVLVLYDYNRLRDLLDPVSRTLAHYGAQIFSVSQPVEPLAPGEYSPYAADSSMIMEGMSRIISQAQIADLRRKYSYAMPRRIMERGLPLHIPYGYRKPPGRETDSKATPVQDHRAAIVVRMKDMLLEGMSLRQIALTLDAEGIPTPRGGRRWYVNTVGAILRNPFYAGIVRFGVTKNRLDPRTGKRVRTFRKQADKIATGVGKHVPLWDEATHREIIAMMDRRGKYHPGIRGSQLSGLLVCGVCGAKMWVTLYAYFKEDTDRVKMFRCSEGGHVTVNAHDAVMRVAQLIAKAAKRRAIDDDLPDVIAPDYAAQLADLESTRNRLEEAYLAGVWSLADFTRRAVAIDNQIAETQERLNGLELEKEEQQRRIYALGGLAAMVDHLPQYMEKGNPREINNLLRGIVDRIVVDPDGEFVVFLR